MFSGDCRHNAEYHVAMTTTLDSQDERGGWMGGLGGGQPSGE